MIVHDIRPEVLRAIEDSIREVLHEYELESYQIEPKEDASGDEAIFIDLNYRLSQQPFETVMTSKIRNAVMDRLLELQENRFPYVRHNFKSGQKVRSCSGLPNSLLQHERCW